MNQKQCAPYEHKSKCKKIISKNRVQKPKQALFGDL